MNSKLNSVTLLDSLGALFVEYFLLELLHGLSYSFSGCSGHNSLLLGDHISALDSIGGDKEALRQELLHLLLVAHLVLVCKVVVLLFVLLSEGVPSFSNCLGGDGTRLAWVRISYLFAMLYIEEDVCRRGLLWLHDVVGNLWLVESF